jgi:hypothetical protein
MNLIVEFDLQEDTTPEQLADFLKFVESFPDCNGTYTYENAVPPMPNNGRVSFASPSEHVQQHLQYLFGQLKIVRSFEAVWESPAVMSGVIGTDVHTDGTRNAYERAGAVAPTRKDWGVAWFGKNATSGVCERCQDHRQVYQGYNGGAHIGRFCSACKQPVLSNVA